MKPEIELVRKLVSTIHLLQELTEALEQSDTCFRAHEQRCKKFGIELALVLVCRVYGLQAYGLDKEISDADNKQ